MNIFLHNDYRKLLRLIVKEKKQFDPKFGFYQLAEAARIQRPYLSKVVKGSASLSSDQMYLISRALELDVKQQEFMQLLLEYDRTAIAERRKQLEEQIKKINEENRDPSAHLEAKALEVDTGASIIADYYLDPLMQIVHVGLSIEHFSKNPYLMAAELHISGPQLHTILSGLERMGLAYRDGQRYMVREPSLHLPKTSPIFRAWRNQMKLLSAQRINQLQDQEFFSFSTAFSANPATQQDIREKFLEFLKACEKSVKDAPAKQVYQLSFDLFPWTLK